MWTVIRPSHSSRSCGVYGCQVCALGAIHHRWSLANLVQLVLHMPLKPHPRGAPNLSPAGQVVRLSINMAPAWGCRVPHGTGVAAWGGRRCCRFPCWAWSGVVPHSGVSRRHTRSRRAVPGERARPRRHAIVAVGGSSPSAVCLLLTVSRAPGLVRLCRVAALHICAGARLRRGDSGARLSSDASPARGGAQLLPPLGRTKGPVANQRAAVTGRPGGWRSTRAPPQRAPAVPPRIPQ